MRKKISVFIVLFLTFVGTMTAQQKPVHYDITGTWAGSEADTVFVWQDQGLRGHVAIDTVLTKPDHTFSLQGSLPYPQRLTLSFHERVVTNSDAQISVDVMAEGAPIHVDVRAANDSLMANLGRFKVKGGKQQRVLGMIESMDMLQSILAMLEGMGSADSLLQQQVAEVDQRLTLFLDSVKDYEASTYLIADYLVPNYPLSRAWDAYRNLTERVKATPLGLRLHEELCLLDKVQQGQPAPDFTLTDAQGQPFQLSSLKGKVVLLDFWASWCGPCRREIPNLKAIYDKYHSQGLEVVSVSLDESRANWLKAVKDEGMAWRQLSSLQAFNCPAARLYSVKAIPAIFLIDKSGHIVANDLRGEHLAEAVALLMK